MIEAAIEANALIELEMTAIRSASCPSRNPLANEHFSRDVYSRATAILEEVDCFKMWEQILKQWAGGDVRVKKSAPLSDDD